MTVTMGDSMYSAMSIMYANNSQLSKIDGARGQARMEAVNRDN